MIERTAKNFDLLKKEFFEKYSGNSHIQEIIPTRENEFIDIDPEHLSRLHNFAQRNPIYHNQYEDIIQNTECIVYEGDINQYWINSLKHDSSCQPFYPTWIVSAYLAVLLAKNLGYEEIIDIGSGDGRIAYCAKILGLESIGIEIDEFLVELQKSISDSTNVHFNQICYDATIFDYASLNLKKPAIFTGGLPQMGDVLASNIIEKIQKNNSLKNHSCIILAGSDSKKQNSVKHSHFGWGPLIEKYNMKVVDKITLPTVWTFDQPIGTPYLYTTFN